MKKKAFTLLEIIISLVLLATLLTFLFHAMHQSIQVEKKLDEARKVLLKREYLQSRLQDIFLSLTPYRLPPLYTQLFPNEKKESLVLYFDNGIDPDPKFSGSVLGRIYINEQNQLCLITWPSEKASKKWRQEILVDKVLDFHIQFLGQKQSLGKSDSYRLKHTTKQLSLNYEKYKRDEELTPNLVWHTMWPQKKLETPSIIRLLICEENAEIPFVFFLSKVEPLVTYTTSL